MKSGRKYKINDEYKHGHELTYEELKRLLFEYKDKHGEFPTTAKFTYKNNIPTPKIYKQLLASQNMTLKDLWHDCGKIGNVRTENEDYNKWLTKYINVIKLRGKISNKFSILHHISIPRLVSISGVLTNKSR